MQSEMLKELITKVMNYRCESQTVELKSAHNGCPKRLYDTLSSFSNQDSGGVIIFGLEESGKEIRAVGVYDAQDLQKRVKEQCDEMEPPVRALFSICEFGGSVCVSAEIPSVDISERPVFYKGAGRTKGSYIRVGEADEPMSEYEIYTYEAFRKHIRDDIRTVSNAKMSLFDRDRLNNYIADLKRERRNLADNISDEEILELMGVMSDGLPTLAGLMTFSKYPQGYFPQLCITAVRVPGLEMGTTGDSGERFIDNKRITGAIPDMLDEAVDFVSRNSRQKTIIDDSGKRTDRSEYPMKAVREAVLNALVHRDYSIHTENVPIRIEMYSDRMEIISSGGLYGRITIDSLGKVRPDTRNAALANMLEILHITENRYSGIPTIRREFEQTGLPAPVFEVRRGEFTVIFRNDFYKTDVSETKRITDYDILEYCKTPRSRDELQKFTGFSRYYTMSKIVQPLVDSGKLNLTMPDKPKSSHQRYFSVP
ncbi:MAG: putative DNA binding domain-containing protein [Ruminiclostridium sp.]|nr:putative DNA binding domain-containing protein [Ruminiclostridium sp.]